MASRACTEIVRALYTGLLGRQATDGEVSSWLASLQSGLSLVELVRGFESSPERAYIEAHRHRLRPYPPLDGPSLLIVDVGAAPLPTEDDIFRPLLNAGACHVIGFEPSTDAHDLRDRDWTMLDHVVGDGSTAHLL